MRGRQRLAGRRGLRLGGPGARCLDRRGGGLVRSEASLPPEPAFPCCLSIAAPNRVRPARRCAWRNRQAIGISARYVLTGVVPSADSLLTVASVSFPRHDLAGLDPVVFPHSHSPAATCRRGQCASQQATRVVVRAAARPERSLRGKPVRNREAKTGNHRRCFCERVDWFCGSKGVLCVLCVLAQVLQSPRLRLKEKLRPLFSEKLVQWPACKRGSAVHLAVHTSTCNYTFSDSPHTSIFLLAQRVRMSRRAIAL